MTIRTDLRILLMAALLAGGASTVYWLFRSGPKQETNASKPSSAENVTRPSPSAPSGQTAQQQQPPVTSKTPSTTKPLEYMLASLDAGGGPVAESDIKVLRFRYLLKSLSERMGETQYDIANGTAQTTNYIRETYGKEVKNLELMEQTNKLVSSKATKPLWAGMKYGEVAMGMAKTLIETR